MCWLLSGCSTDSRTVSSVKMQGVNKPVPVNQSHVPIQPPTVTVRPVVEIQDAPVSAMESCSRELKALKRLDSRLYNRRKAQFDRLMSSASLYAGLRSDVAGGTRETVDAMYRFRTGRLCAEISRDMLDALARQGEGSLSGIGR
ncbi:TPA: hypothetical protein ACJGL8_004644 [Salmonella enterica subsp. enterica]